MPHGRVGDVGELGEEGHVQVRVQPLGDRGGGRARAASADHDQTLAHVTSVDRYSTAGGFASVFDTQHTRRARVTRVSSSSAGTAARAVTTIVAVAQLAARALGPHVDRQARRLVHRRRAARTCATARQKQLASAAQKTSVGIAPPSAPPAYSGSSTGMRWPRASTVAGVAALPGRGDLERVSQRGLPGTPRRRARAPPRRRPTCAPGRRRGRRRAGGRRAPGRARAGPARGRARRRRRRA